MLDEPHKLYRFFAGDGSLLYVGLTCNPGRRMERHRRDKPWWDDVARVEMESFPDRASVRAAERTAIETERPRHNIRMNGDSYTQRPRVAATMRPIALARGLKVDEVYALGLDDGTCPVGLVIGGDADGVVIAPLSWFTGSFDLPDRWVPFDAIRRWMRADVMSRAAAEAEGWNVDLVKRVYAVDPLGEFQTRWHEQHAPESEPTSPPSVRKLHV